MIDPATVLDDDDFQEIVIPGERKRAKLTQSKEPELATRCSICSTYWTNSGSHRIITLKCGHAFGERCALDLIQAKGASAECPICSEPIRKTHIRPIWPTKLLHDESEVNELKLQLEQTQATLKKTIQQLEDTNAQYQQCKQTLHEFSQDQSLYSQDVSQQQHQTSLSAPPLDTTDAPFVIADTKALSYERHVTRVMTVIAEEEMIVTTMKQGKQNHGLYKLSLRDLRSYEYIGNHAGLVRDVKSSRKTTDNGNVALLSTGFDKTLKLTSAANNCVLLSYSLPVVGWSCEFDIFNENQLYCGLSNNSILVFDIRNTKEHLQKLYDDRTAAVPLHSMISCQLSNESTTNSTLICASLTQTYQWKWDQGEHVPSCDIFQAQKKGFQPYSLAFDEKELALLVSSRASGSSSKQTVIRQPTNDTREICSNWNILWEYTCPRYQKNMAKTDYYEGIAYFSDDTGAIYSRNKDGAKQTILSDQDEQILDIKSTHIQNRHFLISLTDNRLKLYNKDG